MNQAVGWKSAGEQEDREFEDCIPKEFGHRKVMPASADNKLYSEILAKARKQLFWDQKTNPPAINSPRFIQRVMELGTWEMVEALEANFSKSLLVETLQAAPCGSLSPRSWNFWCLRLGVEIPYPSRFADY